MVKILLIEDEPGVADAVRFALTREGHDCVWAGLAKPGLALFQDGGFDLVILDVGLPDHSGFDVVQRIRRTAATPVIFLTARAEEVDRVVGLELGADDYLTKPFSPRELVARVRAILRRSQPDNGHTQAERVAAASPGDFHIDEHKLRILCRGVALDLSPYEYRLFSFLIRHPGRVYSRDQLLASAWQDAGARLDRAVDAHIKNIRARLKKIDSALDPIKTHRGWIRYGRPRSRPPSFVT